MTVGSAAAEGEPADAVTPAGAEPTLHRGYLAGTTEAGGAATITVQAVEIVDFATGQGSSLCETLLIDQVEASRISAEGYLPVVNLEPRKWELHQVPDRSDQIRLLDRLDHGSSPMAEELTVPLEWLSHRLLARVTHPRQGMDPTAPLLHGAAVATPDGAGVLMLGKSGTGKSTLAAHLVHRGFDLLNDEQVSVFAADRLLGGFTRPVDIKAGGAAALPRDVSAALTDDGCGWRLSASRLGGRHVLSARPVVVVLPDRTTGSLEPAVEAVDPVEALEVLCLNNLDLERKVVPGLRALAWLAGNVPMVRLRYRSAESGARAIGDLVTDPPPHRPVPFSIDDHSARATPAVTSSGRMVERYGPSISTVSVEIGDRVILFHRGSMAVARLNPAGARTWSRLLEPPEDLEDESHEPAETLFSPAEADLLEELSALGFVTDSEPRSFPGEGDGSRPPTRWPKLIRLLRYARQGHSGESRGT